MLGHRSAWAILFAFVVMWSADARAQSLDAVPLWSLILEVRTCNISNGGTDDDVLITIGNKQFKLNKGGGERGRNAFDTYELIAAVSAGRSAPTTALNGNDLVTSLFVSKPGSDLWCINELNLYANGTSAPFYRWTGLLKLDSSGGLSTSATFPPIRTGGSGASGWADSWYGSASTIAGMLSPPTSLGPTFLHTYFDTTQGNLNWVEGMGPNTLDGIYPFTDYADDLHWGAVDGADHVEIDAASPNELHVDYDLGYYYAGGTSPWRETDGDIHVRFTCQPDGSITAFGSYADCDVNALGGTQSTVCTNNLLTPMNTFHGHVLGRVLASIRALGRTCSAISVTSAGEVRFF